MSIPKRGEQNSPCGGGGFAPAAGAGGIAAERRAELFLRQCCRMILFPMQWGGLPLPGRALLFDVEK